MDKLIKFELYKLLKKKLLYIFLGVAVGFLLIVYLINLSTDILFAKMNPDTFYVTLPLDNIFSATENSDYYLLLGLFIAIFVCEDYSTGAIKNVCTKGYTRLQIVISKFVSSLIAAFVLLISVYVANILFSLCCAGIASAQVSNLTVNFDMAQTLIDSIGYRILLQFLLVIAYTSFYLMISISLGKLGASIPLAFLGNSIIYLLLSLITLILRLKDVNLGEYWLSGISSTINSEIVKNDKLLVYSLLLIAYSLIFIALSWLATRKKEVK